MAAIRTRQRVEPLEHALARIVRHARAAVAYGDHDRCAFGAHVEFDLAVAGREARGVLDQIVDCLTQQERVAAYARHAIDAYDQLLRLRRQARRTIRPDRHEQFADLQQLR